MDVHLKIRPRQIGLFLGMIALYLATQSLLSEYLVEEVIHPNADSVFSQVLDLFSVNLEDSLPTWFSTINLFVAAMLLFTITMGKFKQGDQQRWYWLGLGSLFLYLSMDEGAVIHEIIAEPLHEKFDTSGYLEFGWQIVAVPLVIIFGLLYLRFLIQLPRTTRYWFIFSGLVYVSGALLVEGISANEASRDGITMTYLAIATVEEFFEMIGVIFFIYALLAYMVDLDATVVFQSPETDAAPSPFFNWESPLFRRGVVGIIVVILLTNIIFIYGANSLKSPSTVVIERSTPTHHLIADELGADGFVVTQFSGSFGADNLAARQLTAALLSIYDEVMVVNLIESDVGLVIAGNSNAINTDNLTQMLQDNGETEFVIFDTAVVQVFSENIAE